MKGCSSELELLYATTEIKVGNPKQFVTKVGCVVSAKILQTGVWGAKKLMST